MKMAESQREERENGGGGALHCAQTSVIGKVAAVGLAAPGRGSMAEWQHGINSVSYLFFFFLCLSLFIRPFSMANAGMGKPWLVAVVLRRSPLRRLAPPLRAAALSPPYLCCISCTCAVCAYINACTAHIGQLFLHCLLLSASFHRTVASRTSFPAGFHAHLFSLRTSGCTAPHIFPPYLRTRLFTVNATFCNRENCVRHLLRNSFMTTRRRLRDALDLRAAGDVKWRRA